MGAIWVSGAEFVGQLAELVGFKLGLVVTEDQLRRVVDRVGMGDHWPHDSEAVYRYRSETYEELVLAILVALGDPDAARANLPPVLSILRALPASQQEFGESVIKYLLPQLGPLIEATPRGSALDPTALLDDVEKVHGPAGVLITVRFLEELTARMFISPWSKMRRREWSDVVPLSDLFATEGTTGTWGTFFDQRFIDYLDANFVDIDDVSWRRFEALVAEYLYRQGLHVELGSGRNDDGIDIRVWFPDVDARGPATVLVQCKRQRRKVEKTVIKALATDVEWHGAEVGLLVTTASWAPGARMTAATREYPVIEADRTTLHRWVESMRTPGAGAWMAE